jgi:predicted TIM-barrel fold metal-dependent hydrolase
LFPEHPISKQNITPTLSYRKPENFQLNFTHPLNFEFLLNPDIISSYYGEATDFSKLKICIGHFGGEDEWAIYKKQQSTTSTTYKSVYTFEPLDIHQPWLGNSLQRYNWLTIIKELIRKYSNVYADISFILHDKSIYPILKSMLKDRTLRHKILYGTDFYVVATVVDEPELIVMMKKYLTEAEIKLISYDNALKFLSSKLNSINY